MTDDALLTDSRRLPGPKPAAGPARRSRGRHAAPTACAEAIIAAWRQRVAEMLAAVGWDGEEIRALRFPGGASLAITAPVDALYAATEVNEWAWAARPSPTSRRCPPRRPWQRPPRDLRAKIARRAKARPRRPPRRGAGARGRLRARRPVVSVGLGTGSRSFPVDGHPRPATLRLVAASMTSRSCWSPDSTARPPRCASSPRWRGRTGATPAGAAPRAWYVDGESLGTGDFSGPEGARMVVRDRAGRDGGAGDGPGRHAAPRPRRRARRRGGRHQHRGGSLRGIRRPRPGRADRGQAGHRQGDRPGGRLVLNADDPLPRRGCQRAERPLAWFGCRAIEAGPGDGPYPRDCRSPRSRARPWCSGAAPGRHRSFLSTRSPSPWVGPPGTTWPTPWRRPSPPGASASPRTRSARHSVPSAPAPARTSAAGTSSRIAVPASCSTTPTIPMAWTPSPPSPAAAGGPAAGAHRPGGGPGRRGDPRPGPERLRHPARSRSHQGNEELSPGRPEGQIPALMREEFERDGIPAGAITVSDGELAGVREALAWAREGDLLVLAVHAERPAVLELLAARVRSRRRCPRRAGSSGGTSASAGRLRRPGPPAEPRHPASGPSSRPGRCPRRVAALS